MPLGYARLRKPSKHGSIKHAGGVRTVPAENPLKDSLTNVILAVAILGGSYVIMHFFARAMYVRCADCHTLNARRRDVCRSCGRGLR